MVQAEKQRSTIKIYFDILTVTEEEGEAKTTRIIQKANLPHDRLMKHVAELQKRGLLSEYEDGGSRYYRVTSKGLEFVREVRRAQSFLSAFGVAI
ncbi:MAG: winged helix DNA-binding protein [Nitrososphaerota archaeon]|nr:winged helix DNA-binding protein [Nitrososphaerota archaeon]MDG6975457.1 winged helix DNA-binding protein [Nitrososphaerota archaeon]MDG7010382.1 winged helix DNA-binding protein [Nitrososphaerota archaeon]MDG7020021.1 winged helix DNA-binding protein [Nitrososphaerota archaeon]MDG7027206.1 winged helix DNA-binding protein [Nitrososphaerota archaeon]